MKNDSRRGIEKIAGRFSLPKDDFTNRRTSSGKSDSNITAEPENRKMRTTKESGNSCRRACRSQNAQLMQYHSNEQKADDKRQ